MEQIIINTEWRKIAVKPYGLIKLQNLSMINSAEVTVHIGRIPLADTGGFLLRDDSVFETLVADDDVYVKSNKTSNLAYQYIPMERKYPFYTNVTTHTDRTINGSSSFEVVGMHTLIIQNIGNTTLKFALNPADNTDGEGFTLEPGKHMGFELISNAMCKVYGNGRISTLITSMINREAVRGPMGLTGPQGPKGDKGDTGVQGLVGPKGDKGDRGESGPQGPIGPNGPQGLKGDKGETGDKGDKGDKGDQGVPGIKGADGLTNYELAVKNGYIGTEEEWLESVKGVKGDKGDRGEKGDKGDTGERGATGPQGPKGDTGATGPQGPIGATGQKGDIGSSGPAGPPGATGPAGPQGSPGPKGDMGIQGPQGERGPIGLTGTPGAIGPKGLSAYEVWLTQGHSGTEQDFYYWIGTLVELPDGMYTKPIALGTTDLDTLKEPKMYYQDSNANTSTARHYPVNLAGSLMVLKSAGVSQIYTVYNTSRMFIRSFYGSAWTAWHEMYGTHNFTPSNYYTKAESNNLLSGKSDTSHNHDTVYYLKTQVDNLLGGKANSSHGNHVPAYQGANNTIFLRNDGNWATVTPGNIGAYTKGEVDNLLGGKANSSHGNHVPAPQSANNSVFLRNDNTWQVVSPGNIGAYTRGEVDNLINGRAPASHTHGYMSDGGSYGTIRLSNYFRSTGNSGWVNETHGGGWFMQDSSWIRNYGSKSLYVGGANIACTGDIIGFYSDERLKKNFKPVDNALELINSIQPYYYEQNEFAEVLGYKENHDVQIGFKAQDMEKVLPQVIQEAAINSSEDITQEIMDMIGDEPIKTINYAKITPLLWQAVIELTNKVKVLEEKLNR